jgi:hypothetical protein
MVRCRRARLAAFAVVLAFSGRAFADEPSPDARAEARQRFDRGLQLFDDGDSAGALAQFKRAYELIPNPTVLFNVGLTYAAMNRPVEAVEAFDRLLAAPGNLSADRLARARTTRAAQAERIGEVAVTVNVPGATIEVDNVEAGKAPLAGPLKLAGGTHIVGALAAGYSPVRKEVTVAGRGKGAVSLELVAMQGRLAHLALHTHLPDADVVVDGQSLGKTPLIATLTLGPGPHKVELKRPGYVSAKQDFVLGDGATGDVTLEPEEDTAALGTEGGLLALDLREDNAVVAVDGKTRGVYAAPLRLVRGVHQIRIERAGFEAFERQVNLTSAGTTTVHVQLEPTPETRATYSSSARTKRAIGIAGVLVGAALAGAGGGFLAYNVGQKRSAQSNYDSTRTGPICDLPAGADMTTCNNAITTAYNSLQDTKNRDAIGYVGVGVGGALLITGIVLLAVGGDPHKYDHTGGDAVGLRVMPRVWAGPGLGGLWLDGAF